MDWTFWLLLAASLAGLYALGLVGYRLFLSGKGLNTNRWRELGALPPHASDGRLVVAAPSHWAP